MKYAGIIAALCFVGTAQGMRWAQRPSTLRLLPRRQLFKVRPTSPLAQPAIPDSPPAFFRPLTIDRWQQPADITPQLKQWGIQEGSLPELSKALQYPTGIAGYHADQAERVRMQRAFDLGYMVGMQPGDISSALAQQRIPTPTPAPSSRMARFTRSLKQGIGIQPRNRLRQVTLQQQGIDPAHAAQAEQIVLQTVRDLGFDPQQISLNFQDFRVGAAYVQQQQTGTTPTVVISLDLKKIPLRNLPGVIAHEAGHIKKGHIGASSITKKAEEQLALLRYQIETTPYQTIDPQQIETLQSKTDILRTQARVFEQAQETEADIFAATQTDPSFAQSFVRHLQSDKKPTGSLPLASLVESHPPRDIRIRYLTDITAQRTAEQTLRQQGLDPAQFRSKYYLGEGSFTPPMAQKSPLIRQIP